MEKDPGVAAGDARDALAEAARLMAEGRSRAAAPLLGRALAASPDNAGAWRLLGDIQLVGGDVAGAQAAYDRMLCAVIPNPRLRQPAVDLAEGRLVAAREALRAMLQHNPADLGAAHLLGEVLARAGDLGAAEPLLAHVVAAAPALNLARLAYALVLQRLGKAEDALAVLAPLLAREPRHNRGRMARAALLTELGDYAGAAETTAAVLADFPDQPLGWLVQGNGLRTLGRIDEAVAAYRRCLAIDPGSADAWWSLANLKAYRFTADEVAAMAAELASAAIPAQRRGLLSFALAKAHEDAGRYEEAFAAYARGNAVERAERAYDPERTRSQVAATKRLFTPAFLGQRAGWGEPEGGPIFIVGLPRSGSTLVEQILASHPAVEGTRELMDVQQMADWIATRSGGYPGAIAGLSRPEARQLGHDYLSRTRPLRRLGRPYFIDKAPWNWLHVGLIGVMLPNARIVDVRRHPLGCCLSAYKQHFAGGFDFTYDLADLGRYYADYVDLMAHFDRVAPRRICRVIYEELVADTEHQVRRLLDALRLPFDPVVLRFFENRRPVATPSSEQVRRPVFTDAVDHWRKFEPWLGPLKAALGPVLAAYPDAPPGAGS